MSPIGLQGRKVGGSASDAPFDDNHLLYLDLHTQQITLLPTSIERLSIPPTLLFTKDQMHGIIMIAIETEKEIKQKINSRCKQWWKY